MKRGLLPFYCNASRLQSREVMRLLYWAASACLRTCNFNLIVFWYLLCFVYFVAVYIYLFIVLYLFRHYSFIYLSVYIDDQVSCSGLVSVTIPLKIDTQYTIWYIVMSFEAQPDIDWVYVGEVRFFGTARQPSASITSKPGISLYILPNSQYYVGPSVTLYNVEMLYCEHKICKTAK